MKMIAPGLRGLICTAVVAVSSTAGAEEFICEAEQYDCLQNSVTLANQTTESDTIRFVEGFHYPFNSYPFRCAPSIEGDITIIGAGSNATYLSAQGSCAYFHVKNGSSLTLRDIAISDGNHDGFKAEPGEAQRGAAVYNEGVLRIERSILRNNGINDNFELLSGGGAIYNAPGATAYVSDATFFYNNVEQESYGGGAILNEGKMTITRTHFFENNGRGGIILNGLPGATTEASLIISDSIIDNNYISTGIRNGSTYYSKLLVERTTIRDGATAEGAGIYNSGKMTVRESTIAFNTATRGGGIYSAEGSTSTVINSTISHNHAEGEAEGDGIGGGVFNYGGSLYFSNSTISSNTSDGLGAAIAATSDVDGTARVYVKSSLIVGHSNLRVNQSCYDFGPNDVPKILLVANNLISEESNCYPSTTDIVVNEASVFTEVIGPLAENGGPTLTHALLPDSPAIDHTGASCADTNGLPILIDQRGITRTGCDIGSVEASITVEPPVIELQLLLPGKHPVIRPQSNSPLEIAILSRADSTNPFKPAVEVDRKSIRVGRANAKPSKFIKRDVNHDGIDDLVIKLKTRETGIACGDTAIELRGSMNGTNKFVASTSITTIGCPRH
ncbi:MAG: hypothetical protein B0W54_24055 [Cellvibrio sp. 79]|nr:MAG: hypothetical protein B0W54_24055 [Cellvibrio sp. 79]